MSPKSLIKHIVIAILTFEAKLVVKKYTPRIVAITGTVGKTSTKDAVYTVVKDSFRTRKSEKSFNSEFGLPLTILGLPTGWNNPLVWLSNIVKGALLLIGHHTYPELLVLEIGADRPGNIASVAAWLPIDIAIITAIGDTPVHVAFYNSPEDVAKEKLSLLSGLVPGGVAIVNGDDPRIVLPSHLPERARTLSYGMSPSCDIVGSSVSPLSEDGALLGMALDIIYEDSAHHAVIYGTVGEHQGYMAIAAYAVGRTLGIPDATIIEHIRNIVPTPGRMRILEGVRGSTIIDGTYNAAPASVEAALHTLATLSVPGKKIVVLGDMLELGDYAEDAHTTIGTVAGGACDELFIIGEYAHTLGASAKDNGLPESHIHTEESVKTIITILTETIKPGDVVLIKGSQGMRMERIVKALMASPEHAPKLLVRQEKEWQQKD